MTFVEVVTKVAHCLLYFMASVLNATRQSISFSSIAIDAVSFGKTGSCGVFGVCSRIGGGVSGYVVGEGSSLVVVFSCGGTCTVSIISVISVVSVVSGE